MGREVRRVPRGWEHPRRSDGRYVPLHDGATYARDVALHAATVAAWESEERPTDPVLSAIFDEMLRHKRAGGSLEDWAGPRPRQEDYMPVWSPAEATHWQMYECTSEGTPISPVFADPEDLARWLADTRASAFARQPASYEQWLATIKRGSAPSCVVQGPGDVVSGVSGLLKA